MGPQQGPSRSTGPPHVFGRFCTRGRRGSTPKEAPTWGTSLFPAKREAKREATKAWQAWPRNQTSWRCLVRSLVGGAPSPGRPNGIVGCHAELQAHPSPPNGEALTLGNDSRGRTSGECGWAPSRAQVGAWGRHTFFGRPLPPRPRGQNKLHVYADIFI